MPCTSVHWVTGGTSSPRKSVPLIPKGSLHKQQKVNQQETSNQGSGGKRLLKGKTIDAFSQDKTAINSM